MESETDRRLARLENAIEKLALDMSKLVHIQERQLVLTEKLLAVEKTVVDLQEELQYWRAVRLIMAWVFGGGLVAGMAAWAIIQRMVGGGA